MKSENILLALVVAFSFASSLIYLLPLIADRMAGMIGTDSREAQQTRDRIFKHINGFITVIVTVLSAIYLFHYAI